MNHEEYTALMETELDKDTELSEIMKQAELSEQAMAAVKSAFKMLQAVSDEVPEETLKALAALAGVGNPEPEQKQEDNKPAGEMDDKQEGEDNMDDKSNVSKGTPELPEHVRKELDDLAAKNEAIQKELDDSKERETQREYIAKAEAFDVPHFPTANVATVLRTFDEKFGDTSDEAKNIRNMFSTVTKMDSLAKAMDEIGQPGSGDTGDPEEQLESIAKEIAKDEKCSYEQGYDKAMQRNPDLYKKLKG